MDSKIDTVEFEVQTTRGHARKLGPIEGFFAMDQRQELYSNFAIIAKFSRDIKTNRSLLVKTLRAMILKYPILCCTIHNFSEQKAGINDHIKAISRIRLEDVIIELPEEITSLPGIDDKFRKINQIIIHHEINRTPWRIGFLDDFTLVYISNHCLSDGSSGKHFIEDFHLYYNEYLQNPGDSLKDEVIFNYEKDHEKLPDLPPAIESIINYEPSFYNTIKAIIGLIILEFFAYKSQVKCSKADTHVYRTFTIPPLDLSKLLASLKSKPEFKVTLTPYIHAAWLSTLHQHGLTSLVNLTGVLVPCNTRQYLPKGYDRDQFRYGSCVSSSNMPYYTSNLFNWDTLMKYNEHYRQAFINRDFLYQTFGLLRVGWLSLLLGMDNEEFFTNGVVGKSRGQSCISNIVAVKNQTPIGKEDLKLKNVWFAQHACSTPHSFSIGVVSSPQGGLNMTVAMVDGTVPLTTFDKIIDTFQELVLSYDTID